MKFIVFSLLVVFIYSNSLYSSVSIDDNLVKHTGVHYATFENVCLINQPTSLFLNIIFYIKNIYDYFTLKKYLSDHRFGSLTDNINFNISSMPNSHIYNGNMWISRGCCPSVMHFMDYFAYWIMFQNPSLYPKIDSIFFTQFQPNTVYEYHNLLTNLFIPKNVNVIFSYKLKKILRKNGIICFKRIHYLIRSENGNYAMIYRSIKIRNQFRDHCYKYMNLPYSNTKNIKSLFIYRKIELSKRMLLNQKGVLKVLKSMGLDIKPTYFDGKSVKEQISIIKNVNLVVNIYGSSLVNLLWISSNNAFVIDLTGIYSFNDFQRYAIVNGYIHFSIFTTKYYIDFNNTYNSLVFNAFPCFHESVEYKHPLFETNGNNLTISLNQLKYAIFYGMNYLKYSLFGKPL